MIRLSTAYLLAFMALARDLFDQDVAKGLVFIGYVHGNVGHLDHNPADRGRFDSLDHVPTQAEARPLRPHKLALSLGLARETVRRKSAELAAEGWLVETGRGFAASPRAAASEKLLGAILRNKMLVDELIGELASVGLAARPEPEAVRAPPYRAIIRLSLGYVLRCMDEVRQLFDGDILTGLIFCAVIDANTAHLIGAAGARYAALEDHVPDDLRRPISALALSTRLGLPRETVRRHVRKLEQKGACETVEGGLVVPQAVLRQPHIVAATVRNAANVRLLVRQLRDAGY
ncbi:winged helix-turn-helix domain-containing protein [Phenylobacterium montanum]|uniref:Winged helix-turn-helix transcriptional regulator n=1 Tax=Phenylobacterium montanum TaxID=2823693 RepID=A0A975G347_9CAUL|nr:winged helix-turn-helix transcriptional regulator [Caulobacter sp. S6]QUD89637.1 winged helix-turn-helix transcriptional regulator [Caulobacter sp. S6]